MFQATESFAMNNAVPVTLETGPDFALFLRSFSPPTLSAQNGKGEKGYFLPFFPKRFDLSEFHNPSPGRGRPRDRPIS